MCLRAIVCLCSGVPSTVYWIFHELYGSDGSEPLCRYVVDMYQLPVTDTDMIRFIKGPKVLTLSYLLTYLLAYSHLYT